MDYPVVHWAGDSTVKKNNINRYPQSGIGQYFDLFLKPFVFVFDHAENGRSTKSFIDEGRAKVIGDNLKPGDFLFIQFGHNDEKQNDPARYTEPYGSYTENLKFFCDLARSKGAHPLLITPVYRRQFEEDKKSLKPGNHKDYPDAMKAFAKACGVPCVDLCTLSKELIEKAGFEETKSWFMHLRSGEYLPFKDQEDNSHLKPKGAIIFGALIADGLKKIGPPYSDILIPLEEAESYSELAQYGIFGKDDTCPNPGKKAALLDEDAGYKA